METVNHLIAMARCEVEAALNSLKPRLFIKDTELTFIMRLPGNPVCEMIVTSDDLSEVAMVIERRIKGDVGAVSGGPGLVTVSDAAQNVWGLTAREKHVLVSILDGVSSNRAIAARLSISVSTVDKHLEAIARKTRMSKKVDVVTALLRSQCRAIDEGSSLDKALRLETPAKGGKEE